MKKSSKFLAGLLLTGWPIMFGCGAQNGNVEATDSNLDIVGGAAVSSSLYNSYFTSIVSLRFYGSHFCGGTLIAPNKVLTAAHCLADFSSSTIRNNVKVVLGNISLNSSSGTESFSISSYKINSDYDPYSSQNDIALITLNGSSKFTPAPINSDSSLPAVGVKTYVAGWGSTREGGNVSSALKYTAVAVVSNADCAKAYGNDIYEGNICAYTAKTDSCQGDSGGPLYTYDGEKMTLVGIVSWGNGCARSGYPGVYTRVSEFSSFL